MDNTRDLVVDFKIMILIDDNIKIKDKLSIMIQIIFGVSFSLLPASFNLPLSNRLKISAKERDFL